MNVNGRRLRNLSMIQASAVLRLPVPVVEMVVCRGAARVDRAKRRSVDDLLQENEATIVLVNGESLPIRRSKQNEPCYENVVLPPDGDSRATIQPQPSPQHLDDSGVEISENGSCSSGSHLEADLLELAVPTGTSGIFRGQVRKSLNSSDSEPSGGASAASRNVNSNGDLTLHSGSTGAGPSGKKKNSDFCTLPRRPRTHVSHSFYTIVYEKGPGKKSLGFTIVGGIDSPTGPMSFFVKTYDIHFSLLYS